MEKGNLFVIGIIRNITQRSAENKAIAISFSETHINLYKKGAICYSTEVIDHEPETLTGDLLSLKDPKYNKGYGLVRDYLELATSGFGVYFTFDVYEFSNGEYVLNPEKILEVWYPDNEDIYFGRMHINKGLGPLK